MITVRCEEKVELLNDLPFSESDTTDGKHFLSIFHLYVLIIFRS